MERACIQFATGLSENKKTKVLIRTEYIYICTTVLDIFQTETMINDSHILAKHLKNVLLNCQNFCGLIRKWPAIIEKYVKTHKLGVYH